MAPIQDTSPYEEIQELNALYEVLKNSFQKLTPLKPYNDIREPLTLHQLSDIHTRYINLIERHQFLTSNLIVSELDRKSIDQMRRAALALHHEILATDTNKSYKQLRKMHRKALKRAVDTSTMNNSKTENSRLTKDLEMIANAENSIKIMNLGVLLPIINISISAAGFGAIVGSLVGPVSYVIIGASVAAFASILLKVLLQSKSS